MASKELNAEHKKYWKYPERSCKNCIKYPCFIGQEGHADFAKYGCVKYDDKSTTL